jgi:hypothetical protein
MAKAPQLFDFINDVSFKKERLIDQDPENEKHVGQFMMNRAFSYGLDTIFYANDMNKCQDIDNRMAYEYYYYALTPKKRFNKWLKPDKMNYLEDIQNYYQLSYVKAVEVLRVLTESQILEIHNRLDHEIRKEKT